jgi:hypothetical protein
MAKKKLVKRTLSKVEKFYIEKNCYNHTLTEICKDLGCAENIASSHYEECLANIKKADTIDKLMVVDSKNGYAVMTKEASEKGEKTKPERTVRLDTSHIHKIR